MKIILFGFLRALVLAFDSAAFLLGFCCLVLLGFCSLLGLGIYNGWRVLRR